jgi:hypothetical protein
MKRKRKIAKSAKAAKREALGLREYKRAARRLIADGERLTNQWQALSLLDASRTADPIDIFENLRDRTLKLFISDRSLRGLISERA